MRPPRAGRPSDLVVAVDDEVAILRSLERLLRKEPYELLTTLRPAQALEWVRAREVGVVLADSRMPEMGGVELLEELAAARPATRRVLFTGYPGQTPTAPDLSNGLYILVPKPWDDEALRGTIRRLLRERRAEPAR